MGQNVFLQANRLNETLFTLLTSIRLLPTMYPGMCLQVIRFSKPLLTLLTRKRLLPTVYPDMYLQAT